MEEYYVAGMGANLTVNATTALRAEAGGTVERRCFQMRGSGADVCYSRRGAPNATAGAFTVGEFEVSLVIDTAVDIRGVSRGNARPPPFTPPA